MSTVIRIPGKTFKRLQRLAVPFEDSPASVIERLLDFHDQRTAFGPLPDKSTIESVNSGGAGPRVLDPWKPADLTHTRVIEATIDTRSTTKWNELVQEAHRVAMARVGSIDALTEITNSNISGGRRTDKGFQYLEDIDVSIQNVDSNLAWRNTLHLARQLSVPVTVRLEWREKEGASFPGQEAVLSWVPESERNEATDSLGAKESPRIRWVDEVTCALENLGGAGSLTEIYEQIQLVRAELTSEWRATVRQTIETHSSDSDNYTGGRDLFFSVSGIGQGRWGLRSQRKDRDAQAAQGRISRLA